jgi:hypothetical protein
MIKEIAENIGEEEEVVANVVDEFCCQLHKRIFEYKGLNGDFIGEELHYLIPSQAFFHLLCFLQEFANKYGFDENSASEYLLRLGTRSTWLPYSHQMSGWKKEKN